ncbi:hypothetical protein [Saccharothrix syringae]|uniref:hypothetical protein n=1 Tax=Saccharothrix syringae TaxID=103733 RepID=UPI000526B79E|nr:hypothetical protein [Saccharothrix syringae]
MIARGTLLAASAGPARADATVGVDPAADQGAWEGCHVDAATRGLVRQVNVHGYQGPGGRRDPLADDVRAAGEVENRLYVPARFTRHTRPGTRVLGTGVDHAAAHDPDARRLVVVAVNTGAAQDLPFDPSRFGRVAGRRVTAPFAAGRVRTIQVRTIQVDGVVR